MWHKRTRVRARWCSLTEVRIIARQWDKGVKTTGPEHAFNWLPSTRYTHELKTACRNQPTWPIMTEGNFVPRKGYPVYSFAWFSFFLVVLQFRESNFTCLGYVTLFSIRVDPVEYNQMKLGKCPPVLSASPVCFAVALSCLLTLRRGGRAH